MSMDTIFAFQTNLIYSHTKTNPLVFRISIVSIIHCIYTDFMVVYAFILCFACLVEKQ